MANKAWQIWQNTPFSWWQCQFNASAGWLVGGALVNALVFWGLNCLFSILRSSDLNEDRKRHDQAIEQLQAAQAEWSRKRTECLDWISEDLCHQGHAVQTLRDVNYAVRKYSRVTRKNLTPWDISPSCKTCMCRAVAKETMRSPSLYWGWPRPAWWPTNSLSNLKRNACCGSASISYSQHAIFLLPDQPLVALQHSFLGPWLPHVGGLSGCWNTSMEVDRKLSFRLAGIYYNPRGYWKGLAAIKNLSAAAKVTEQQAKEWLKKQAICQVYLPAPRHIQLRKFDVAVPSEVHQANLLFLPHDRVRQKTFRYALKVVPNR